MRVGMIGCGTAGRAHAEAYRDLPGVSLAAVADADAGAAAGLAAQFGATVMSPAELVDSAVDVVDVATPTALHAPWVGAAARRGKHVLCETPLARTVEEARSAIESCREAGVRLLPLHLHSFAPPLSKAGELLAGGGIGKVGVVRITRRRPGIPASAGHWRGSLQESGGVILEMLSQDIAFLLDCCGPVERVYAASTAWREIMNGEYALVSLRFRSGAIAHLDGSWLAEQEGGDEFELAGSNGLVAFSAQSSSPLRLILGPDPGRSRILESPLAEGMYALGLAAVVKSLAGGSGPPVSPDLALEVVEVSLAALESAATGRVLTLGSKGVRQ